MIAITRWRFIVVILVLVAAASRAPYLTRTIEYDEAYTYRHYAFSPVYALADYGLPNNHLLNSLSIWAMTSVAGGSTLAIRLPAFIAGPLSVAAIYRLASRLAGQASGIAAACLLIANPAVSQYTVAARGYSLSLLLTALLLDVLTSECTLGRNRRLIVLSAAVMMTLPSMALLLVGAGGWALWKDRARVIPLAVGAICGSLFYVASVVTGRYDLHFTFGYTDPLALLLDSSSLLLLAALALPLVAGIWLYRDTRLAQLTIFILASSIILSAAQWIATGVTFFPRNYVFLFGLVAVVAGAGLVRLLARTWPWVAAGALAGGLVLMPPWDSRTEVGQVLDYVQRYATPEDGLMLGCCVNEPVWYYLTGQPGSPGLSPNFHNQRVFLVPGIEDASKVAESYGFDLSGYDCRPAVGDNLPVVVICQSISGPGAGVLHDEKRVDSASQVR